MKAQVDACYCSTCRGAAKIPAAGTRPAAYLHEIQPPSGERPAEVLPAAPVAPPQTRRPRIAPVAMTPEEKIAAINSRADIGAAMKKMQISNILRKLKQND